MVDKINTPGGISPLGPRKIDPAQTDRVRQEKEGTSPSAGRAGDRATISANAAEVARYQEMARLHREAYGPTDRQAKLDEVRQRIADGHYDKPEVLDAIAGNVVETSAADHARASDVDIARRRSAEGFYDKPEVINKTADKILGRLFGQEPEEG